MEFDLLSILRLIGGLALFIYGMTTMGSGLERAAGAKLEKTLERMTGNIFKALIMARRSPRSSNPHPPPRLWWSAL